MADNKAGAIHLVVLTPTRKLVDVRCDDVSFPSTLGRLQILPHHAALVCQVGTGVLFYNHEGVTTFLSVSGGVADVSNDTVTLLADVAELAIQIDVPRAEQQLTRAQAVLSGKTAADVETAQQKEAKAIARLEAATMHSGARRT